MKKRQHRFPHMKTARKKYTILVLASALLLIALFSEWTYTKVETTTKPLLFDNLDEIPFRETGLLLGTSPTLKDGRENLYFRYRIEAAASLYQARKINTILISGDNGRETYDEPTKMKEALLAIGIPDSVIFLDYAGFRTIDSVIRSKEIFSRDSVTIISQPFHNTRALYIAQHYGLHAVAYNAKDVRGKSELHQKIRERGARVKLFIDLYLFDYKPHFLGKKEEMP